MKRAGYRVVATPASRVWHRGGGRNRTSNLPVYYLWRNSFHFFIESVAGTPHVELFIQVFLKRVFLAISLSRHLGKPNSCRTIVSAMWDAILGRRGPAPASRIHPLDLGLVQQLRQRIGINPAFLCPEIEFYTALHVLLGKEASAGEKPHFFTSVPVDRLPVWLVERVRLRPEAELEALPAETTLVVLCRHLISGPHPSEARWRKLLQGKGVRVCFFDQHSNAVWGMVALSRLRKSLANDWLWFHDWIAPLLMERLTEKKAKAMHED
jgi:hypothetical protein